MKKSFTIMAGAAILLFACQSFQSASAQEIGSINPVVMSQDADVCPGIMPDYKPLGNSSKAQWDILSSFDITAATAGATGCAGVCYVNGSLWVSKWASDSIYEFTPAGVLTDRFVISGLSGVRSMTYDGTYLYAGPNTTTIYRIDPATKTLAPPHITVAANARWVTYDATLDGAAGGFWYGNFGTDITAVDMTGAVLTSIPAATHGLLGMYGAAIDNISVGGPYLWIFDQGGANTTQIECVSIATGTPTIYNRDAFLDFNTTYSLASGLAGGLFLSPSFSAGNLSLIGVIQGTPNVLFAYDIDHPAGLTEEQGAKSILHIFPNPNQGIFTLLLPANCPDSKISILEPTGRLLTNLFSGDNSTNIRIDLSAYPQGVYYLRLENENFSETQKIIISK